MFPLSFKIFLPATTFLLDSNPLWHTMDFKATYIVDQNEDPIGNYTVVAFTIHLQRRSEFFVANVILPSVLINYLSLASFQISPHSEENIAFSVTIFLAQTVNMMSTYQFIPNGGVEIPIWGKYLVASVIHLTLIVLVNINLTRSRNGGKHKQFESSQFSFAHIRHSVKRLLFVNKNMTRVKPTEIFEVKSMEKKDDNHSVEAMKVQKIVVIQKLLFLVDSVCVSLITFITLIQMLN